MKVDNSVTRWLLLTRKDTLHDFDVMVTDNVISIMFYSERCRQLQVLYFSHRKHSPSETIMLQIKGQLKQNYFKESWNII
jgi:hypothetical protein